MKNILVVLIGMILVSAGCTSSPAQEKCLPGTILTVNGKTTVCVEEKMTDSCTVEGSVYKQTENSKTVCSGGKWTVQQLPTRTQVSPPVPVNNSASAQECSGTTSTTTNRGTQACVNGKMTESCSTEGEVYSESEIFHDKIICENGKWVEKSTE